MLLLRALSPACAARAAPCRTQVPNPLQPEDTLFCVRCGHGMVPALVWPLDLPLLHAERLAKAAERFTEPPAAVA